jgi:hypothetical protein
MISDDGLNCGDFLLGSHTGTFNFLFSVGNHEWSEIQFRKVDWFNQSTFIGRRLLIDANLPRRGGFDLALRDAYCKTPADTAAVTGPLLSDFQIRFNSLHPRLVSAAKHSGSKVVSILNCNSSISTKGAPKE